MFLTIGVFVDCYAERIAHHHSKRFSPLTPDPDNSVYWAEPHATVNRAGTKVLWGSNWRQDMNLVTSVDTYLCDFTPWIGVPSQLNINNINVGNGQDRCFNATQSIVVAGNGTTFHVGIGGSSTLISGGSIHLNPGATVLTGGFMHAFITTTSAFCHPNVPVVATAPVQNNDDDQPGGLLKSQQNRGQDANLHIYPNPASGTFFVEVNSADKNSEVIVCLYDITGVQIKKEKNISPGKLEFSLDGLPAGVYPIRIIAGNKVYQTRIVKQPRGKQEDRK